MEFLRTYDIVRDDNTGDKESYVELRHGMHLYYLMPYIDVMTLEPDEHPLQIQDNHDTSETYAPYCKPIEGYGTFPSYIPIKAPKTALAKGYFLISKYGDYVMRITPVLRKVTNSNNKTGAWSATRELKYTFKIELISAALTTKIDPRCKDEEHGNYQTVKAIMESIKAHGGQVKLENASLTVNKTDPVTKERTMIKNQPYYNVFLRAALNGNAIPRGRASQKVGTYDGLVEYPESAKRLIRALRELSPNERQQIKNEVNFNKLWTPGVNIVKALFRLKKNMNLGLNTSNITSHMNRMAEEVRHEPGNLNNQHMAYLMRGTLGNVPRSQLMQGKRTPHLKTHYKNFFVKIPQSAIKKDGKLVSINDIKRSLGIGQRLPSRRGGSKTVESPKPTAVAKTASTKSKGAKKTTSMEKAPRTRGSKRTDDTKVMRGRSTKAPHESVKTRKKPPSPNANVNESGRRLRQKTSMTTVTGSSTSAHDLAGALSYAVQKSRGKGGSKKP